MTAAPVVSIVVAASTNNVIGIDGELPWRLPEDLKRFKAITMGKPIIMGRLTHESIGRPLPGRQNIVLTRRADYRVPGCDVVADPQAALQAAADADKVMVIGGGQVYRQFLSQASEIYLTRVHTTTVGDAFFPSLHDAEWVLEQSEEFAADGNREHGFSFEFYRRRGWPEVAP